MYLHRVGLHISFDLLVKSPWRGLSQDENWGVGRVKGTAMDGMHGLWLYVQLSSKQRDREGKPIRVKKIKTPTTETGRPRDSLSRSLSIYLSVYLSNTIASAVKGNNILSYR